MVVAIIVTEESARGKGTTARVTSRFNTKEEAQKFLSQTRFRTGTPQLVEFETEAQLQAEVQKRFRAPREEPTQTRQRELREAKRRERSTIARVRTGQNVQRKQSNITAINKEIRDSTGAERTRLIARRNRIANVPASQFTVARQSSAQSGTGDPVPAKAEVKIAFGGSTKDATPSQIKEAKETGKDFFIGGERFGPTAKVVSATQKAKVKAERIERLTTKIRQAPITSAVDVGQTISAAGIRKEFATSLFERQAFQVTQRPTGLSAVRPGEQVVVSGRDVVTARGPVSGEGLKLDPQFKPRLGTGDTKKGISLDLFRAGKAFTRFERGVAERTTLRLPKIKQSTFLSAAKRTLAPQRLFTRTPFAPEFLKKQAVVSKQERLVAGFGAGVQESIRERPVQFGVAVAGGGAFAGVARVASVSKKATRIVKGVGLGLGTVFVGSKAIETVIAPTAFQKGKVLGTIPVEVGGFALGAKAVRGVEKVATLLRPVDVRLATKPQITIQETPPTQAQPLGGKVAEVAPIEFAAQIGKSKFAGKGAGAIKISEIDQKFLTQGTFKFGLVAEKRPKQLISAVTQTKGVFEPTTFGFKGVSTIKTTVTPPKGKELVTKVVAATKGVQVAGGDFPITVTKVGVFRSTLGKGIVPIEGRVGISRKKAEVIRDLTFTRTQEFTPEEFGQRLITEGKLKSIEARPTLKDFSAFGIFLPGKRDTAGRIFLDEGLAKTRTGAILKAAGRSLREESLFRDPKEFFRQFTFRSKTTRRNVLRHELIHASFTGNRGQFINKAGKQIEKEVSGARINKRKTGSIWCCRSRWWSFCWSC